MHLLAEECPTGAQHGLVVVGARSQTGRSEQVPGEVLLKEPVVGHIVVEGPHEVIAVLPGVGDGEVGFVAAGFGIPHQVHPVARPALPEMRRGQEPIDRLLPCGGPGLRLQSLAFLRARGQPCDGGTGAAEPDRVLDGFRRAEPPLLERVQDEMIDGILGPLRATDRGDGLAAWRFPKPCLGLSTLLEIEPILGRGFRGFRGLAAGPDGSCRHPAPQILPHRFGQSCPF